MQELTATVKLLRRRLSIREMADGLRDWLKENAPECCEEQRHLDAGTPERAYWHYGYLCALHDILRRESTSN
jgi:hypothetical protein